MARIILLSEPMGMVTRPLLKTLLEAGLGPRRRLAEAIKEGRVTVNSQAVTSFSHPVDTEKDAIALDGQRLRFEKVENICLMLHKPAGLLSTVSDDRGRPTVMDLLPSKYRRYRLYPVGRLDRDTSGLLLLTNDGQLTYRLTHPKFECEKEYLVLLKDRLRETEIKKLERGIPLEDGLTSPATVREIRTGPPFQYAITIHEGRKRQVRRMFAWLGHPVMALKRTRLGGLSLGDLKEGEIRILGPKDITRLLGGKVQNG